MIFRLTRIFAFVVCWLSTISGVTAQGSSQTHVMIDISGGPAELEISAIWTPTDMACGKGSVVGPTILRIVRKTDQKTISLSVDNVSFFNHFESSGRTEFTRDDLLWLLGQSLLEVNLSDYLASHTKTCSDGASSCLVLSEAPISFSDLNYDEKNELVVRRGCHGQRYRDTFAVFEFPELEEFDWQIDRFYDEFSEEPFRSLDSGTEINVTTRKIVIDRSGGACNSDLLTYTYANKPFSRSFNLTIFETLDLENFEYPFKTGQCEYREYEVTEKIQYSGMFQLKLVSSRTIR
jgi:hypothetical protein